MKKYVKIVICMALVLSFGCLAGCSGLMSELNVLKGSLLGTNYTITEYDNFGNKIMTVHGNKIDMDGGIDSEGNETSYIDITIDGKKWEHVGGTLIFAQEGANMITDFQIPDETIDVNSNSSGLIYIDKVVNSYANYIGKKAVVLVSSQTGAPIALFQGDNCYTEVPDDLPKTTLIYIDGKMVYVHRANIDILPASMFTGNSLIVD